MGSIKRWVIPILVVGFIGVFILLFSNKDETGETEDDPSDSEPVIQYTENTVEESDGYEDTSENEKSPSIEEIKDEVDKHIEDQEIANENALIEYEDEDEFAVEDFNKLYADKFGEKALVESRRIAYEKMMLLLKGDMKLKKWEDDVTASFMDEVKELNRVARITDRPINSVQLLPAEPINEEQITIGILADTTDSTSFWHMSFEVDNDNCLIDRLDLVWER